MASLSDERAQELHQHAARTITLNRFNIGIELNSDIPFLTKDSVLHWYPSVYPVCVSPIPEEGSVCWGQGRPLFYTEIKARGVRAINRRLRLKHKRVVRLINSSDFF